MPPKKDKPTGYEPIDYDKLLGAIKQLKINKISERAACVTQFTIRYVGKINYLT